MNGFSASKETPLPSSARLILGDCLRAMKRMESESVDAVITDPPYGVNVAAWDSEMPPQKVLDQCLRVSRGVVLWFGGSKSLWSFADYRPRPERVLIWAPPFGRTAKDGAFYQWHVIAVWRPDQHHGRLGLDVLQHNSTNSSKCWWNHPGTKPVDLMIDLVKWAVKDEGVVLDPFMGSGTTGVACIQAGRDFVGIEIDHDYFKIAERRIAGAPRRNK